MGNESSSQKGFFLVVVLLLGVFVIVSYFQSGRGEESTGAFVRSGISPPPKISTSTLNIPPPVNVAPTWHVEYCTFNTGNPGWKACTCPQSTPIVTGQTGYNCNAPDWQCGLTYARGPSIVYYYHDGQAQAYAAVICTALS